MGMKRKTEPVKWTESLMQNKLVNFRSSPRYILQNLYVFGWESDILFLSKSGYWTEIEIKVSRTDFKADIKNKGEKHRLLSDKNNFIKPNQFFYAVPEGLINADEIPDYAGLLTVNESFFGVNVKKPAPWLHHHKIDPNQLNLADKFYYNMVNAKRESLIAKRTAENLTDAYSQGIKEGKRITTDAVIHLAINDCPFRKITEEGRIFCQELNQTSYNLCAHASCTYLDALINKIENLI